jgi:hypothetical protein
VPVEHADIGHYGPHTGAMSMDCSTAGWSAVTSALPNATLAAVLAGFMINGMVLVLGRKPEEMQAAYVQAVSLMFAAFVVLGLDAYLFGFVTGDTNVSACRRAWTEAMFAAGLLGIGAVAIIVGFVVLFDAYLSRAKQDGRDSDKQDWKESLRLLQRLCNVLRRAVAFVVVGLLWVTARSYLSAVYNDRIPTFGNRFLAAYSFGIVLALVGVIVEAKRGNIVQLGPNSRMKPLRIPRMKALRIAIYSSIFYSVFSVGLAGFAASQPVGDWGPTSLLTRVMILVAVVWVLLVSVIPLVLLLVSTVPNFAEFENPQRRSSNLN